MLNIDVNRALDVHKKQVRTKREILFKDLDIQFMRALEVGNTELAAEIGAKKQSLRDATNIDSGSITNLSDVKSLWDTDILGETPYR
jgi:hypothetical protein